MKRLLRFLLIKLPLCYVALSLLLVLLLKYVPVYYTPLMLKRHVQNREDKEYVMKKKWRSLERISPAAARCVVASEDNKYFDHKGFDYEEFSKVARAHVEKGKKMRGCSTISQQTAKNVFTFCSRTAARKVLEAYYTVLIEKIWGKERIMEVYLNVAEMGKGIFGIEAASRNHFGISAAELDVSKAALIAASLPDPQHRNPAKPTKFMLSRQKSVIKITHDLSYPDWLDYEPVK